MNRWGRLLNVWRRLKFRLLCDNRPEGTPPRIVQPVLFTGRGTIFFGKDVTLGWFPSPGFFSGYTHLEARDEGKIIVGNNVFANNNLTIIAETEIVIGEDTLIGANTEIIDSDFHGLSPNERRSGNHAKAPVFIGRNVFLGNNVKVLKGVVIGDNTVVANGSIVTKSFGENLIIGGIPAKVIGHL